MILAEEWPHFISVDNVVGINTPAQGNTRCCGTAAGTTACAAIPAVATILNRAESDFCVGWATGVGDTGHVAVVGAVTHALRASGRDGAI